MTPERKRKYTPEKKSSRESDSSRKRFEKKEVEKSSNQSSPEKSSSSASLISNSTLKLLPNISPLTSLAPQPSTAAIVAPVPALPSYYNPGVVNATKFADQQKKRKLLWSGKASAETKKDVPWTNTAFSQDNDGSRTNKFFRLMGIKDGKKMNLILIKK